MNNGNGLQKLDNAVRLRAIDAFMRSRWALIVVPVLVWSCYVGLLVLAGRPADLTFAGRGTALAAIAVVGVLSWRRLWRSSRNAWEIGVYGMGVRLIGSLLWFVFTVGGALFAPPPDYVVNALPFRAACLVIFGAAIFALTLWLGYLIGVGLNGFLGISNESAGRGLPPPICGA